MGWRSAPSNWKGPFHIICPGLTQSESDSSISDGLSNTLAVGERSKPTDDADVLIWDPTVNHGTFWASSNAASISDVFPFDETQRVRQTLKCITDIPLPTQSSRLRACLFGPWASYHPGGNNWLMCDGSVRFKATNIDVSIFCEMATVAGGEVVSSP